MRKIIMMAIAGFVWKQIQAKMLKPAPAARRTRRT